MSVKVERMVANARSTALQAQTKQQQVAQEKALAALRDDVDKVRGEWRGTVGKGCTETWR